jgi:hypothetical protein
VHDAPEDASVWLTLSRVRLGRAVREPEPSMDWRQQLGWRAASVRLDRLEPLPVVLGEADDAGTLFRLIALSFMRVHTLSSWSRSAPKRVVSRYRPTLARTACLQVQSGRGSAALPH